MDVTVNCGILGALGIDYIFRVLLHDLLHVPKERA